MLVHILLAFGLKETLIRISESFVEGFQISTEEQRMENKRESGWE